MVEAGGASGDPSGGAQGADGEGVARGGAVGQLQAFAVGGEENGVVADDVAAADGMEADFLFGAFADEAGAAVHGDVGQGPAVAGGGGFAPFSPLAAEESGNMRKLVFITICAMRGTKACST